MVKFAYCGTRNVAIFCLLFRLIYRLWKIRLCNKVASIPKHCIVKTLHNENIALLKLCIIKKNLHLGVVKSGLIVRRTCVPESGFWLLWENVEVGFCLGVWRREEQLNLILCLHPPPLWVKNLPWLIFLDTVQSPPWPLYTSHHPLLQFSQVGHGTHWCQSQQSSSCFHNFLAAMQIKSKLRITLQFKMGAKMLWTLADVDHFYLLFITEIVGVQHKAQTYCHTVEIE